MVLHYASGMPTVVVYHDLPIIASSITDTRDDLSIVEVDDTEEAVRALHDADMFVVNPSNWDDRLLDGLSEGYWIQSTSAGYHAFPLDAFEEQGIRYTNAAGNHGPMVAEHVFAMAFAHSRELHRLRTRQREANWDRSIGMDLGDWLGKTLTIVGLGRIGEAVAERGRAFTMNVYGIKRHPADYEGCVSAERVLCPGGLEDVLPETDLLVLSVPLVEETYHLVDADVLKTLPESAFLVNIGRGGVIDENGLIDALEAGEIAGAGLDVFEEEPLPASSSLWDRDDVIITPHVAARSDGFGQRFATLFLDNYDRRQAGEPLKNVIV